MSMNAPHVPFVGSDVAHLCTPDVHGTHPDWRVLVEIAQSLQFNHKALQTVTMSYAESSTCMCPGLKGKTICNARASDVFNEDARN